MRTFQLLTLVTLIASVSGCGAVRRYFEDPFVHLTQDDENYKFTIPESSFVLIVPKSTGLVVKKNGFQQTVDDEPEFVFESVTWIEPKGHPDIKMWAYLRKDILEMQEPSTEEVGSWKAFFYETKIPGNSRTVASWREQGKSIVFSISLTSGDSAADRREQLRQTLNLIKLAAKP